MIEAGLGVIIFALALFAVSKHKTEKSEGIYVNRNSNMDHVNIEIPGKPNYPSIKLQTRMGTDIENKQVKEISQSALNLAPDFKKQFPGVEIRTQPNPIYNCHGKTFGCSRTTIGPESIRTILDEDGYTEVK